MHSSSISNMQRCFDKFLRPYLDQIEGTAKVVDCGSMDVNGSYRTVFDHPEFEYIGVDMSPGPGVDLVCSDPYKYDFPDNFCEVVVSGQMLEHSEFFWLTFTEMVRITKPRGLIFLIVPSSGYIHRFPVDCYRFLPDSMNALAKWSGCQLLDSWHDQEGSEWGDLVGVFYVPEGPEQSGDTQATALADSATTARFHEGKNYIDYLGQEVSALGSQAHLEIGSCNGDSLAAISAPSLSVDPAFKISTDCIGQKETALFFQMTSDDFFDRYDPQTLMGRPLDTAFLDGMHLFEFLLRDFINTEAASHSETIIFIHDVLPLSVEMAVRDQSAVPTAGPYAYWWTGDVWKLIPILKQYRPDLTITCLDCHPTGLLRVEGLDPNNRELINQYDNIVNQWQNKELPEIQDVEAFLNDCDIQSAG